MKDEMAATSAWRSRVRPMLGSSRKWLVTGSAGFIGSHLVESLLELGQDVVGLDNFVTGSRSNLEEVRESVDPSSWKRFSFIEADIVDLDACREACKGIDVVLHQAALGSVPRSIRNPIAAHDVNVTGFLNLLVSAREAGAGRFVYASSSSVYGDHAGLPRVEDVVGAPLSPYAVTKRANELYAAAFERCYGFAPVGLRYFNVFGPRQDPEGPYAAVIPKFVAAMLDGKRTSIFGDGETTRDFCYVDNVVQANLLAALVPGQPGLEPIYNIAVGERMSLNELHVVLRDLIAARHPDIEILPPHYEGFRTGDVRHSEADIAKACRFLGYRPQWDARGGLSVSMAWYELRFARAMESKA
jgi:UDP-N-acetylglucosamine 4-epimerase